LTKLKKIDSLESIKEVFEVNLIDGTKGIIEMDTTKYRPIINGKICDKCPKTTHCLYLKLHEPDEYCPKNVIKYLK
jgi:hypothetical protein